MICFQISIFEPLETTAGLNPAMLYALWFAFKLVSLNHWKQPYSIIGSARRVVICFQISIFEPLETTTISGCYVILTLWFAFKLVSLNHWKQLQRRDRVGGHRLWFAFKLVSLNHWKQPLPLIPVTFRCCDLLSN